VSFDLEHHVDVAKLLLAQMVADEMEFCPMVVAIRGTEEVSIVIPPEGDGGVISSVAIVMAAGFRADRLLIVSDSYVSLSPKNPLTGDDWRSGELEKVVREDAGIERGWVSEVLTLALVARDKAVQPVLRVFPYVRRGSVVEWGNPLWDDSPEEQDQIVGRLIDVFGGPMLPAEMSSEIGDYVTASVLAEKLECRQVLMPNG
jgi:hypothetical protein